MENMNNAIREAIIYRRKFTHINSEDADMKRLMYRKEELIKTLLLSLDNNFRK